MVIRLFHPNGILGASQEHCDMETYGRGIMRGALMSVRKWCNWSLFQQAQPCSRLFGTPLGKLVVGPTR